MQVISIQTDQVFTREDILPGVHKTNDKLKRHTLCISEEETTTQVFLPNKLLHREENLRQSQTGIAVASKENSGRKDTC